MKALWRDRVVAEAPEDELLRIDGAWYFPPSNVDRELLLASPTPYTCSWRGDIQYYSLAADGEVAHDAAWCYPSMPPEAIQRIGTDARQYLAFGPAVTLV
ncbi:hypothetical protein GCM10027064_12370 [Microbacterium petrolearium]|jgi:uncharacterized protein (DUF427 family)